MPYHLEENVAREITDLCKQVGGGSVTHVEMDMSLTHDLRFDSTKLMQFFSRVEQLYAGLALEDWFVEHCADGRDTIGSVARYIADALPLAAAEFSQESPQHDHPSGFVKQASRGSQAGLLPGRSSGESVRPRICRASEDAETWQGHANRGASHGLDPENEGRQ